MKKKMVECASLPLRLAEDTARKVDTILKGLPKTDQYAYRHKTVTDTRAEVTPVERVDVSRVTTSVMDKDCEIVLPQGIELDDYRQNPVVLWGHEQSNPVGKCLWIKPDDTGLVAKTYYIPRPSEYVGEWLPDFVFSMVQADVLRGKSIGFLPLEIRDPEPAESEANPDLQCVITRSILLEYSVVSIPCNPAALVESIGKGIGLDHWQFKVVGRVKPKKAPTPPKPKAYQPMADQVAKVHLNADKIAELAVKRLLDRWDV